MPKVIALIVADLQRNRLGTASRLAARVGQASVLGHTLRRVQRVAAVQAMVVVHPAGQDVSPLLGELSLDKPVTTFADEQGLVDRHTMSRVSARKWALSSWRGGLGGATCYDELLPAAPLLAAMQQQQAESALLVGGDWMLLDPALCAGVLDLHLQAPDALQMTFCQAPPGLSGIALGRDLLEQLAQKSATIGHLLGYVPSRPQADPIGRDVCFQIDPAVRSCVRRWVYDLPSSAARIDALAQRLGNRIDEADAGELVSALAEVEAATPPALQEVTLELTPRRAVNGPIVPQHHVSLDRPDMPMELALDLVRQVGAMGDVVLNLGGLGDALLYEGWPEVVQAAHAAGVLGIAVETDLRCDRATVARLVELPLDVVQVRVNADRAATYERVMAPGEPEAFRALVEHLQWLLTARQQSSDRHDLPWLVPSLVKTTQTLDDMESFFDRWTHFGGQALIAAASSGGGLMPAQSPLVMASPRRRPCRQVQRRLSILSDGTVARCDQDWLAKAAAGSARQTPIASLWQQLQQVREAHDQGRWSELELCAGCVEWHRP